jgi:hypothetical protein
MEVRPRRRIDRNGTINNTHPLTGSGMEFTDNVGEPTGASLEAMEKPEPPVGPAGKPVKRKPA